MEDQQTDRSDLTDTRDATGDDAANGATPAPARGVPVGKRGGRHRYFRPRPVAPTPESTAEAAVAEQDETSAATEVQPGAVEVEPTTVESSATEPESTVVDDITETTELTPERKRRKWFRRRPAAATVEAPAETVESEAAESAGPDTDAVELVGEEPERTRTRKPVGKRLAIAVAVAAALFVAAAAFGGAMLQPYLADRAVADTKLTIARTATDAITTLFTYTPDDMDQLPARTSKFLGGDLRDEYAKQVDALAATNKQNQIRRSAEVVGTAVESLDGSNATAVVYANITYSSAATKDTPKIFLVSYRLAMQRENSNWVITNMPWITSKDLTPIMP